MTLPEINRPVICVHPTPDLQSGRGYNVKFEGRDRFTKADMVVLHEGGTYWAWRFSPGPKKPPGAYARSNADGIGWHWRFD